MEQISPVNLPQSRSLYAGCKTILVVEDETFVRCAACDLLRNFGFDVLEAENAAAARRLFDKHSSGIDLVFADVVLPDGLGTELCESFVTSAPELKCILSAGYPQSAPEAQNSSVSFLIKPFTGASLLNAIQLALTGGFGAELLPRNVADSVQNLPGQLV